MILVTVNPQELCIYYIVASHHGHRHMVPVLRRLRQECCLKFEASLGGPCLKKTQNELRCGDFWEAEAEEPKALLADTEQVPGSVGAEPTLRTLHSE